MADNNILDILTSRNVHALSRINRDGLLNLQDDTDAMITVDMLVSEVLEAAKKIPELMTHLNAENFVLADKKTLH